MSTTSYWLDEPAQALPSRRARRALPTWQSSAAGSPAARARSTLAEAGLRVRLYEAREIAGGASGRNGGFALRGGAAAVSGAGRRDRPRSDARALALDGAVRRGARRACRRCVPTDREPSSGRGRGGAGRATRRVRCAPRRTASRSSGSTSFRIRSATIRRRSSTPPTASSSRRRSSGGSPRARRKRASRSTSTRPCRRQPRRARRRSSSRPTGIRAASSARSRG